MSNEELMNLDRRAWISMGSCAAGHQQMRQAMIEKDYDKALLFARWTKEDAARVEEACAKIIDSRKGKS